MLWSECASAILECDLANFRHIFAIASLWPAILLQCSIIISRFIFVFLSTKRKSCFQAGRTVARSWNNAAWLADPLHTGAFWLPGRGVTLTPLCLSALDRKHGKLFVAHPRPPRPPPAFLARQRAFYSYCRPGG